MSATGAGCIGYQHALQFCRGDTGPHSCVEMVSQLSQFAGMSLMVLLLPQLCLLQ